MGLGEVSKLIFGRPLQNESHSITRLSVHLPNQHTVTIVDEADDEAIRTALETKTMLIDYFALMHRNADDKQFTYSEIPAHYVFKKQKKLFKCIQVRKV